MVLDSGSHEWEAVRARPRGRDVTGRPGNYVKGGMDDGIAEALQPVFNTLRSRFMSFSNDLQDCARCWDLYRVVLNFTSRCSMVCPYCYVPFDYSTVNPVQLAQVVESVLQLKPETLTIGGGDPFSYALVDEILRQCRRAHVFVQVDTNGRGLEKKHVPAIVECVDLLGLPLDGPDARTHGTMRGDTTHFSLVEGWIKTLVDLGVPLKVNSVISRVNIDSIPDLGLYLRALGVRKWSLYQFWPMERGLEHVERFHLDTDVFLKMAQSVSASCPDMRVEVGSITRRRSDYLFVTHNGSMYTIDPNDITKYLSLGSVFRPEDVERIPDFIDFEAQKSRILERMLNE